MQVFEDWGLAIYLAPKPPALPAAPHPDIYSIFQFFAWKWDKLWSNANSTPFCVSLKCRKSAPLKAFRDFRKISATSARHAPKASALPTALRPDVLNFVYQVSANIIRSEILSPCFVNKSPRNALYFFRQKCSLHHPQDAVAFCPLRPDIGIKRCRFPDTV